ncbi:MAG: hypothetical protein K6F21_02550 [Bacteroidales bacterium]|nr:hypothetical protein [Bacteroidales bacterium]
MKLKKFIFCFLIPVFLLFAGCKPYNTLLEAVYDKDQEVRQWTAGMAEASAEETIKHEAEMRKTDSLNQILISYILDEKGWPEGLSDKANQGIWLVIDHADDAFRKKYLPLVKAKAEEGILAKSDYATLYDRVLMNDGKAQIYGTQIHMAAEFVEDQFCMQLYLWPVEDISKLDSLRKEAGLSPIEDYLAKTDSLFGQKVVWDKTKTVEDFL